VPNGEPPRPAIDLPAHLNTASGEFADGLPIGRIYVLPESRARPGWRATLGEESGCASFESVSTGWS